MSVSNGKRCGVCGVVYTVAILGTFLIIGWLASLMLENKPGPLGAERGAERKKAAVEIKATGVEALSNVGWQDQGKQLVRLPVEDAKRLTVQQWKNPAAARSNLLSRVDKATAVPPKAPEKPSQFE